MQHIWAISTYKKLSIQNETLSMNTSFKLVENLANHSSKKTLKTFWNNCHSEHITSKSHIHGSEVIQSSYESYYLLVGLYSADGRQFLHTRHVWFNVFWKSNLLHLNRNFQYCVGVILSSPFGEPYIVRRLPITAVDTATDTINVE